MKRFDYDFLTSKLKNSVLVYTEIPHEEVTRLGEKAAAEYIGPEYPAAVFWRGKPGFGRSIYGRDGWFWLRDYLQGQETILFFSPLSKQPGFRFPDGDKLIQFLKYCRFPIEFYLTNSQGEFLIFNFHEEITYGTGLAETWIDEEHRKIYNLLELPPGQITFQAFQMLEWGNKLQFICLYERETTTKPFDLIFEGCWIKNWNSSAYPKIEPAYQILLRTELHGQEIDIRTHTFDGYFAYRQFRIEK